MNQESPVGEVTETKAELQLVPTESFSCTWAVRMMAGQVPLAQLVSGTEVAYAEPLASLSLWLAVSAGTLIE